MLNEYWYNFTAGRLSVILIRIPDTVVIRIRWEFLPLFQMELVGSTPEWINSLLKVFFNEVKVFYVTCILEWNQCFFFISSWDFDIRCSSLYCCADCSCCSCCCSSEINLIFLHSALDHVSSSGSWKRLWSLTTAVERSVSFPSVDLAFFSPVLSYYFSFAKDSKESVIESPKRCSDESSTVSVNLAYYWTGSDGLMKLLLR